MPRILVVAPNWIGDALMAQPLLARLREKLPALRLDVLAPERVAPVLRRMAEVDEVIDPADSRRWIATALLSAPPRPRSSHKKRPNIDTW